MNSPAASGHKTFTVTEANAMLPLVGQIARDIVGLSNSMLERRELLNQLKAQRNGEASEGLYLDELQDVEKCLQVDADRLRDLVAEINQLDLQVASLSDGIVNFPSLRDEQPVVLSWQFGEPEVGYWHKTDEGFKDRRPLERAVSNRLVDRPSVPASS